MNTSKASPLGTNKNNIKNMVDVRIILSALWVARMLSGLQGDSTRLHDPVALKELVSGTSEIPVTNAMMLVLSIILAIPILMSFLSLTLKDKANRWANIIIGIFFTGFNLIGLPSYSTAYDQFLIILYHQFLVFSRWFSGNVL